MSRYDRKATLCRPIHHWENALMRSANLFIPLAVVFVLALPCPAQEERIPHAQDKPPGPALSPAEAIAKMTVPEGFTV